MGNGVTSIGGDAFRYCTSLSSIVIPDGVTSIGSSAFDNCTSLTSIAIPNSVTSIGNWAFGDCESLKFNEYSNGYYLGNNSNPYHVFIKVKNSSITSCNIHPSTKIIAYNAFNNCSSLTSVVIPDGVTEIGDYAFYKTSLTSIKIPDGVTRIGTYAFRYCTSLTAVYITDIAAWCGISFDADESNPLHYANKLYLNGELVTDLVIPNGVTEIGSYTFSGCTSLTSIKIPDSVTRIGTDAFRYCTSLTSITIGKGVTSIGDWAFSGCTSLTSITIGKGVTSIGGSAFSGCTSLSSIVIPNSVTSIIRDAFYNCTSLTSVIFEDATGWYVTKSYGVASGINLTLTNASQNAGYLNRTYDDYYWYKNK